MKLKLILPLVALATIVASCNKPAGEIAKTGKETSFKEANPNGMIFIKKGSFMMGANTQSAVFEQPDNIFMATVESFWMDETEITNAQYHEFVDWVRDSIARSLFVEHGMEEFALPTKDDDLATNDNENELKPLNWKKKIPWDKLTPEMKEAIMDSMYYSDHTTMNTNILHYRYEWVNYDQAALPQNKFDVATSSYPRGAVARVDTSWIVWVNGSREIRDTTLTRALREPKDLITKKIISIYPDTLVWIRDFQYSYNDPLMQMYFSHKGFANYPVVGVTWEQAHAFCNWRTAYYAANHKERANDYRLPTEAEWEYAARGGRKMAMYPWGSNYARDSKGCFFANFKPYRGSYNDDTGTTTVEVRKYRPNEFGLYDMAGNVAEWTSSSYLTVSNSNVHDFNPDYSYMARKNDPDIYKRKVVKGGSWKDISYFMQCGVRTYEYQYESRPYIGFRCVRAHVGE